MKLMKHVVAGAFAGCFLAFGVSARSAASGAWAHVASVGNASHIQSEVDDHPAWRNAAIMIQDTLASEAYSSMPDYRDVFLETARDQYKVMDQAWPQHQAIVAAFSRFIDAMSKKFKDDREFLVAVHADAERVKPLAQKCQSAEEFVRQLDQLTEQIGGA